MSDDKFSHRATDVLGALGYGSCFFVPGGNIMHLLDSARSRMTCVPFVHEVSAAVAAEYFNEVWGTHSAADSGRSYALVTAGPGITNALTGVAGAYLESRDLLILGGQVKSADLSRGEVRQRGIQEIDGLDIARPVCKVAERIEAPVSDEQLATWVSAGVTDRRGPVFLEFCLDAQGAGNPDAALPVEVSSLPSVIVSEDMAAAVPDAVDAIVAELGGARRPVILVGGGAAPSVAWECADGLTELGVPVMTTWNGFDRVSDEHPMFAGRPNTWGQRAANILLAQADLVVVLGSRLGIQQTGFNWQEWGPGRVIQVDVDQAELDKGHPRVDVKLRADANGVLRGLVSTATAAHQDPQWPEFCREVRSLVPLLDPENSHSDAFISPFELVDQLSDAMSEGEILIPASSGSGQFVPMEVFRAKPGQRVITNKGLASMGYGLAAAIGAALAAPGVRTVLVEGDGSFSQNIQELGTVAVNQPNLKIFLLDNDGYASIRTTQRNYFGGAYLGCDSSTGLGFPRWGALAEAFDIPWVTVGPAGLADPRVRDLFDAPGPAVFVVSVDPEQTYYPKVTSRMTEEGSMQSNPIHFMSPELPDSIAEQVFRFGPWGSSE